MNNVTFSIGIAAYQAAGYIQSALTSIGRQSCPDWEIIVIEDGSHDETESIVSRFASSFPANRITYKNLNVNHGVAAARNRFLDLASGRFMAFLDADDQWEEQHLENLLSCLEGTHVLACTPILIWDGQNERLTGQYRPNPAQLLSPLREIFKRSFIMTSSCVALPRSTFEKVGYFDESLRIGEDRDYWFRAFNTGGSLGCTTLATCRYTKHGASSMTNTLLVARDNVKFYEKHRANSKIARLVSRRLYADALRNVGRLSRSEDMAAARHTFLKAWKIWPPGIDLPLRALLAGF